MKQDWLRTNNSCSWVVGAWRFIILYYFLLLRMFVEHENIQISLKIDMDNCPYTQVGND